MDKYEYEVIVIKKDWTGALKADYYKVLNEMGQKGWRFVQFAPDAAKEQTLNGTIQLIFERKIQS